jgi:hypothetical protein
MMPVPPQKYRYLERIFTAVGLVVFGCFIFVNHDFIGGIFGAIVGFTLFHIVIHLIDIIKKGKN